MSDRDCPVCHEGPMESRRVCDCCGWPSLSATRSEGFAAGYAAAKEDATKVAANWRSLDYPDRTADGRITQWDVAEAIEKGIRSLSPPVAPPAQDGKK